MSAALLLGLLLNSLVGWSWADPVVALVMGGLALKEGRDAWRGDACCVRPHQDLAHNHATEDSCCADETATCTRPKAKPSRPDR